MMLNELVALGDPQYLALDDWGRDKLRYLALGNPEGLHVATIVFDPETVEVWALEIFDPEGLTWVWSKPASNIDLPGHPIDQVQAMQSLGYLLKANNDPT